MEEKTEKRFWQYAFLILMAVLMGYTFLLRASFYDEEGIVRVSQSPFRVFGENIVGDYGLFRLLEKDVPAEKAYDKEEQSRFLSDILGQEKKFISFASPLKAFVFVPWTSLSSANFSQVWIFWGMLLFGIALYTIFPITQAVLLLFAFPALFLTFSTGGWGLFLASSLLIAFSQAEQHPRWAGVFAGLSIIEPIVFCFLMPALFLREKKKAAYIGLAFASLIAVLTLYRYGLESFTTAFKASFIYLYDKPCSFSSFFSYILCGGSPLFVAIFLQLCLIVGVVYGFVRLLKKKDTPFSVKDSYLCASICLLSPLTQLSDYALLYVSVALLLKDSTNRGMLKGDLVFFILAFLSVFFETFFFEKVGTSIQLFLCFIVLFLCSRRGV